MKYLGQPFAEGTSRVVFTLTDNLVLKLAKNNDSAGNMASDGAGEEQNKHEYELYQQIDNPLLPRILYCDKNYYYMICEAVVPAEMEDFEKYLGIPFTSAWRQNSVKSNSKNGGDETVGYNKYFDNIKKPYEEFRGDTVYDILCYIEANYVLDEPCYDSNIEKVIKNSEWFTAFIDLVEETGISDFTSVNNFGIVNRDGNPTIVILDTGLDLDTFENMYC